MNIYVGNVDFKATEAQISQLFEQFGTVQSVNIIKDKFSGKSKGYAFVEMPNDEEGNAAVEKLNGYEFNSRQIAVSVARPQNKTHTGNNRNFGNRNNNRPNNNFRKRE